MEIIQPYIGKHDGASVFLNNGKYGPYLNYKEKLYSVPHCFQTPKFGLKQAISIIDFKNKLSENKNNELVNGEDESTSNKIKRIQEASDMADLKNIVQDIKNKKSLKKSSNE